MKQKFAPAIRLVMAALILLTLCSGCASLFKGQDKSTPEEPKPSETAPLSSDFQDIRLPQELKEVKDETFFMQTGSFSAGVITLRGRVEISSLISFFESQMQADNWQLVGFFRSSRSLMLFYKENRWCVINITEKSIYTYVEVWVAPTLHMAESGLLK